MGEIKITKRQEYVSRYAWERERYEFWPAITPLLQIQSSSSSSWGSFLVVSTRVHGNVGISLAAGLVNRAVWKRLHDGYFQRIQRLFHAPLSLKGILRETVSSPTGWKGCNPRETWNATSQRILIHRVRMKNKGGKKEREKEKHAERYNRAWVVNVTFSCMRAANER